VSQRELLRSVINVLDAAGVPYMVTGSTASSAQGPPRSTHDIDIVVALKPDAIQALLDAYPPPAFFLDRTTIEEALQNQSMFNLLAIEEGEKVDFWLLTDDPFDHARFARRRLADVDGLRFFLSSPEDTILAKLRWSKLSGGSEKQFRDALRVYEIQYGALDLDYLVLWASRLGVEPLLDRIKTEAKPL
jgi:hypothetical protein